MDIHGDLLMCEVNSQDAGSCDKCGKRLTYETENECWWCGDTFCDICINDHDCEDEEEE